MRRAIAMILVLLVAACSAPRICKDSPSGPSLITQAPDEKASRAERYIRAYPDFFTTYEESCLVARDGRKIPFEDGKVKDLDALIIDRTAGDDAFDPEDALHWDYPAGAALPSASSPPSGDPGRIRPAAIFGYMYGATPAQRAKRIRYIKWPGTGKGKARKVWVTTVNGVDKALEKVALAIGSLPDERKRELEGIVFHAEGPYGHYDRPVRGFPGRVSGHAYGISVDINGDLTYFWETNQGKPYRYRNNVPAFLVEIFEKNGFIWGGRWHSYDSMHFEYRPELLLTN
jgi:hypothetical protein